MNQNLEVLFKLVVPAIFLLVWAISQVLNREPAAPPRGRPPGGPRPGLPPNRDLLEQPTGWPASTGQGEEIVFLGPGDPRSAPPRPTPTRARQVRRVRPTSATQATRPEPQRRRKALVQEGLGPTEPPPPTAIRIEAATPSPRPTVTDETPQPTSTLAEVREALFSPRRIREAIVLNELLQPPLTMRPRSHRGLLPTPLLPTPPIGGPPLSRSPSPDGP